VNQAAAYPAKLNGDAKFKKKCQIKNISNSVVLQVGLAHPIRILYTG
jgi:hypothetical protein